LDGDSLPTLPSGAKFTSDCTFLITDVNGVTYTGELSSGLTGFSGAGNTNDFIIYDAGTAYAHDYRIIWNPNNTQPADNDAFAVSIRSPGNYEYSQNSVFLEEDGAATNANSVLVKLGFMAETPPNSGVYAIDTTLVKEAQDAKFTFNGVPITRSSNTINADSEEGALIENVSLELMSEGRVVINITQNAAAAVEAMESFVEAYNEVMTWIDEKLAEKYNSNTVDAEDDYLQSILSEANGSTVFGALHGDQLLWSIKNQLRSMVSNTISTLSTTIRTRKVSFPAEPMNMEGSFYVNSGGKVARIDILSTDSMEDIQRKLRFATNINNGANGAAPAGADMDLEVVLENGQLVIKRPSATAGTATMQDSLTRGSGSSEYLSYVPDTSKPVNGLLTVYSGSATNTATYVEYVQGTDYRISTLENADGVLESKIEWITGGKAPAANSTYSVSYAYDPSAVSFTAIPTTNSSSLYELDFLDLHYDSGRVQLSSYGLATESIDFGKSGLLEFDSDAFFQAIVDDSSIVSKVMTTFMKTFDSYIGNLVDSSQIQVGGAVITKGRIAAALSNIDTEVSSLQSQIDKLETQLALRQTTLYKQYTNMELAIQKLNAQMSSLTQFLTYANSSTSTS
jgi:flagellar hook-associated protein 2